MDVGDQRVDKYGHRDARRIYDDGEYYENPNRTGVRDDDNKKRESHQASNVSPFSL